MTHQTILLRDCPIRLETADDRLLMAMAVAVGILARGRNEPLLTAMQTEICEWSRAKGLAQ